MSLQAVVQAALNAIDQAAQAQIDRTAQDVDAKASQLDNAFESAKQQIHEAAQQAQARVAQANAAGDEYLEQHVASNLESIQGGVIGYIGNLEATTTQAINNRSGIVGAFLAGIETNANATTTTAQIVASQDKHDGEDTVILPDQDEMDTSNMCRACYGTGYADAVFGAEACSECNGTGATKQPRDEVNNSHTATTDEDLLDLRNMDHFPLTENGKPVDDEFVVDLSQQAIDDIHQTKTPAPSFPTPSVLNGATTTRSTPTATQSMPGNASSMPQESPEVITAANAAATTSNAQDGKPSKRKAKRKTR